MQIKRANVIRHQVFEDLGCFAEVLQQKNIAVQYYEAGQDDISAIDPAGDDLLIVLGGAMGVYETDAYPFLTSEISLLEQRLPLDKPTLGICLGAQLMARALGARVYPGEVKEIGWAPVSLTPAGEKSALHYLAEPVHVLHWHGDTFDLPAGAVHLAASEHYVHQAFSCGQRVLGLQFHGECSAQGLESWYLGHEAEIRRNGVPTVATLRAQAALYADDAVRQGQLFFADWLAQVAR